MDIEKKSWLSNNGQDLFKQYQVSRQVTDLNRAIAFWHEALRQTPSTSPGRPGHLNDLSVGLRERYIHTGDLADLDAAITASQQAVQTVPSGSPNRPTFLNNLGRGLYKRYTRTGEMADLEAAISASQQAVQTTPSTSPHLPRYLNNLSDGLHERYTRTGELTDLEATISALQQAVQTTPSTSPNWPVYLHNLDVVLYERYTYTKDLVDLEAAVDASRQALQATPLDSPNRVGRLNNLAIGLHKRYKHTGEVADLEAAISTSRQAVQATPPDSPDRHTYLNNLDIVLREGHKRTEDQADLKSPITAPQQSVQATPSNSSNQPRYLNRLGRELLERYKSTGEVADLEAAINAFQQSVQATPSDSPDWFRWQNNLGLGLQERHKRTRNQADLEAAISAFQQAVEVASPDSPDRPKPLSNLGRKLLERYRSTGEVADLEASINTFQQAVQAAPPGSPDQPTYLNSLGARLHERYTRTGEMADLEAAISARQQAVQVAPLNSPDRPGLWHSLGLGLYEHLGYPPDIANLEAIISALEQSWSIPHLRFAALPVTYQLGQQYQETEVAANLVSAYLSQAFMKQRSVRVIAQLLKILDSIDDSESLPIQLVALVVARVLLSLIRAYEKREEQHQSLLLSIPPRVLEIAEGSKSRLLTQLVGRGPLPRPLGLSPEMAAREQHLLAELTTLDTQELATHDSQLPTQEERGDLQRLQQRQTILHELEELWTYVAHSSPEGAEYVALRRGLAPTWQEFTHLTEMLGPDTALLSLFLIQKWALLFLLRAGWHAPRVVQVPLNQTGWADLQERLLREVHRAGSGAGRSETWDQPLRPLFTEAQRHLSETWDQPLRPLFTEAQRHLKGVKRLILAPAGTGHLLPWAVLAERTGWHTSAGEPLPLVTLPALGVLPRLRKRTRALKGQALVIGNPLGDLSYAENEARSVAERFGATALLGDAATKQAVLANFERASLIHLATHAFFDPTNPLESGIVLAAKEILTAREILQHRLQADLLVLSACESGQVGSLGGEELAGLSQAFLQAGVRSLLVSLWRVDDPATAALMQAFYNAREEGADKALALRQAMTQVQQDRQHPHWRHPHYWGAFILLGDWTDTEQSK